MFIGRLCGWIMVGMALLMASADAVMALGPVDYAGIAAGDVWTLIAGRSPDTVTAPSRFSLETIGLMLMHWPAWMVFGPLGAALAWACRRRPYRRFRPRTFA